MSNKVVLIDCGANIGGSVNYFRNQFKDREMFTYAFECDHLNVKILNKVFEGDKIIISSGKGGYGIIPVSKGLVFDSVESGSKVMINDGKVCLEVIKNSVVIVLPFVNGKQIHIVSMFMDML